MKRLAAFALVASIALAPRALAQQASTEIAVVVRISTPPLLQPDGSPAPDRDRRLQALASAIDALDVPALGAVPLAIAPSAVMCDEAMRLRGNAPKRFLRSLRRLASRSTVLVTPFANVRLPDVATDAVDSELRSGRTTLDRCTGTPTSAILYPPALAIDDPSAAAASNAGVDAVLTTGVAVPVRNSPNLLPVLNMSPGATAATIVAKRPSRTFVITTDLGATTARYIGGLATSTEVVLRTIGAIDADSTNVGKISLSSPAPPPVTYRRALLHADEAFARFSAFTLPDNPLAAAYRDVLARARSSADLTNDFVAGRHLANGLIVRIDEAQRRITVGAGSITFTSRRGSVPVTVNDGDPYPVRLRVDVESPKLDFPNGDSRVVTVDPPGNTITFAAVARSTGSFPVIVSVRAADGSALIARTDLTVRSTAANLPALAVTIGGFVLLIVFYLRRRRRKREAP